MKEAILAPGDLILVGVSGGADSLCLLHSLARLGWQTAALHFDHQLRPESADESARVAELLASWGVRCLVERGNAREAAETLGESIEAAARRLRYECLFRTARRIGAGAVAVGHTADDQAETVLLHLLRGSGGAGLSGMRPVSLPNPWDTQIRLVRPLLATWRQQTVAYCAEQDIRFLSDPSNADLGFTRNRVRAELIPELERYNPRIRQALWRLAEIQAGDQQVLSGAAGQAALDCRLRLEGQAVRLDRAPLAAMPAGLQRLVLRAAAELLRPGLLEVDFEMVERARQYVLAPPRSGQADLANGLVIAVRGGEVSIRPWISVSADRAAPQVPAGAALALASEGRTSLWNGWSVLAERLAGADLHEQAQANQDPFAVWLDEDALRLPLRVRARQPGDKIHPLGMNGQRVKISDLMINLGLARELRAGWPLICQADGTILWAPGLRAGEAARVSGETTRVMRLTMVREPG